MSAINFSDTTPVAVSGGVNVKWQSDASGNVSAYAPATAVSSVFGRTGAIVAVAGDYSAAQVTNAVSTAGSYADPAWITSLAYAKIAGSPTPGQIAAMQTPWLQNIDGGNFQLANVSKIGIGTTTPGAPLQIGSGSAAISFGTSDAAAGMWIRNDGVNTALSTNAGSIFLGFGGNTGKIIHIGNTNPGVLVVTGSAPANSVFIGPAGYVGILTAAPICPLDIAAGTNPSIRAASIIESGVSAGFATNVYWNGSGWIYRAAGAGMLLIANASQTVLYGAAAGSAGGTATLASLFASYASAGAAQINVPLAIALPAPGNATFENGIPGSGVMMALTSNTSLTFRVKGSDGVIRQASLTLA
jgi:hypothetical protein